MYTATRRDGSEFPVEVTSAILRGPRQEVQGYLCITRDITERRQNEIERVQLRLELAHLARVMTMNELSASLAHEINQPLGAILNNASAAKVLLSQVRDKPEDLTEIVEDIIRDTKRAGDVVRKIRGMVKKGEVQFEQVQLNMLINEMLSLFQNSININKTSLRLELTNDLPQVIGDRVHLQQVLLNLITNAMEAMQEKPLRILTIRSGFKAPDVVMVSIADSGPGIKEAVKDIVFKPFFTTKKDGLGFGLAVCRSIIEEHGGQIWAENNPDGGATISFSIKARQGGSA
jgi:C4-dicarboxylate-specific signal transduction histidine kinase